MRTLKLERYLDRIGFHGKARADLQTLIELHRLHPAAIPFENLSTLLGEPVLLDLESLEDKLIERRRGGYCFEQNLLLLAVLEELGFRCTPLSARVLWNATNPTRAPRTHMALLVQLGQDRYLCDVGFGGATLTTPLALATDIEQATPLEPHRLLARETEYELSIRTGAEWRPVYRFDLQPQLPVDFEPLNHFVATHPDSIFRTQLLAGRPDGSGRYALSNNQLVRYERGARVTQEIITSGPRLREVLETAFAIDTRSLPPELDTTLAAIATNRQS